jgi:hypothetical protein
MQAVAGDMKEPKVTQTNGKVALRTSTVQNTFMFGKTKL